MSGQILPLRFLRCSSVLVSFPTNGAVTFRRPFPFKLTYSVVRSRPHHEYGTEARNGPGRTFSTRASRSSSGSVSEWKKRDAIREGSVSGQSKSLRDDEAELSDWVGDLKMDSLLSNLGSGSDESDGEGRPGRTKSSTRGNVGGRRETLASDRPRNSKQRRMSDLDADFDFLSRGQGKDSPRLSQSSRLSKSKPLLNSDSDDDVKEDHSNGWRGASTGQNTSSRLERNRGRDSRLDNRKSKAGFLSPTVHKRGERSRVLNRENVQTSRRGGIGMSEEEYDDIHDERNFKDESLNEYDDKKEVLKKHALDRLEAVEINDARQLQKNSDTEDESYLSNTRFDQCSLSPLTLKGLNAAGYERMTMVQEATLPVILKGKDVLAKAKTGTGKTVAFLAPAIEIILKQPAVNQDNRRPPISVLVICPTRELANQASMEAEKLLKFHPSLGVQFVVGGTRLALEQKRLQANPCQILVATPGRLRDHIENTAGFATRLMGVQVLVLDECDRLLDMGFRKDIDTIIRATPKQRQTLLFSATVPDEVRQICHIALRRDHDFISTVEEGGEETHSQVTQNVLIAPLDQQFSVLYHLLTKHIADDIDYKVLVFCTTAMVTKLVAEMLSELKLNVREIHSRKSQTYRTKVSDEFRKSKGLILVTSDVSARGVDYPDVTLVVQVGLPSDREQYIHRLGRTGRKGKEGQGMLLLAPWEDFFLSTIKDLPVSKLPLPPVDSEQRRKVDQALCHVEMKSKASAYQAWLGYYNSNNVLRRDKIRLVELANEFSRSMGLDNPPAIKKMILGKMGLRNIPGLRSE